MGKNSEKDFVLSFWFLLFLFGLINLVSEIILTFAFLGSSFLAEEDLNTIGLAVVFFTIFHTKLQYAQYR